MRDLSSSSDKTRGLVVGTLFLSWTASTKHDQRNTRSKKHKVKGYTRSKIHKVKDTQGQRNTRSKKHKVKETQGHIYTQGQRNTRSKINSRVFSHDISLKIVMKNCIWITKRTHEREDFAKFVVKHTYSSRTGRRSVAGFFLTCWLIFHFL